MIERWGIRGVTSNPTIFEKAIARSDDYEERITELMAARTSASDIYESLVLEDVRTAADVLRPVYDETHGRDGFVSLEVSPHLVQDTAGTISEAERFWALLDRPNIMIKVPGTTAGLPAIVRLIANGVNVNVTLLFSLERYRQVVDAYLSGLEDAEGAGRPLESIASVASFFLSRIDTMVDPLLDRIVVEKGSHARLAQRLKGEIAIASARRAYAIFRDVSRSTRFRRLAERGARPQRLLWASTGTKNPAYSDVKYVEPLIGLDTVNSMPLDTLKAYDDHGEPAQRLANDAQDAIEILSSLQNVGIDLERITERLLSEGITKFAEPFDALHRFLESRRA